MKPAVFCGVAFPKYTYFRSKGARAGLELSSSSGPALQVPHIHPPWQRQEQCRLWQRGVLPAPAPSPPGANLGSLCLFQLMEDCPIGCAKI